VIVTAEPALCSVQNVSRQFKDILALNQVSFEVLPGQVHLLLGNNGAGKSTLIRILLGLIRASSGIAQLHGLDVWGAKEGRLARQKTGVLFESNSLYLDMTAWENLEYFAKIYRMDSHGWKKIAKELLTKLEIYERRNEAITKWSAGMQRKLAIIRALLPSPQLIILDEPTAGLDVHARVNIRKTIKEFQSKNVGFLMASQDLSEMERVITHLTLLRNGVVLFSGTTRRFHDESKLRRYHGPDHEIQDFLQSMPDGVELVRKETDLVGSSILVKFNEELYYKMRNCGLAETPVSFEDIYLHMSHQPEEIANGAG